MRATHLFILGHSERFKQMRGRVRLVRNLLEMLASKKALSALAGVIVAFALRYGLELDTETVIAVISPIVAYILGQGWADIGKHARLITVAVTAATCFTQVV